MILVARVTPGNVAGTVQFRDGNAALGPPVPVFSGFAFTITWRLTTVGTHLLTAEFKPTNQAAFKPSKSNNVKVKVRGRDGDG